MRHLASLPRWNEKGGELEREKIKKGTRLPLLPAHRADHQKREGKEKKIENKN